MAESHRDEIAKLQSMYDANPEGRVFTHLAEAYRKAGELARARDILEDGLRRHTDSASGFVVLGRVMQDLEQPQEAAAAFARVLELDPENRVALRALGDLARAGGRDEQALAYYQQILALDPSDEAVEGLASELRQRTGGGAQLGAPAPAEAPTDFATEYAAPASGLEPAMQPPDALISSEPFQPLDIGFTDVTLPGAEVEESAQPLAGDLSFPGVEAAAETQPAPEEAESAPVLPTLETSWPATADEPAAWPSLGDEPPAGEAAAEPLPELPSLDVASDTFAQPQPGWGLAGDAEPEQAPASAEVVTETMAELYRSQGHMERAAEVYRALLKERPGDEQLERKLLEVELAILAPDAAAAAPEPVATAPDDAA